MVVISKKRIPSSWPLKGDEYFGPIKSGSFPQVQGARAMGMDLMGAGYKLPPKEMIDTSYQDVPKEFHYYILYR